jgi:hypothetical protein
MRRGLRGATRRPPLERPGNGYGRDLRPGPMPQMRHGERVCLDGLVAMLLADERSTSREREGNGAL